MIGSFVSGTTASLVAKNLTKKLSQPFEELQGSNSKFKLITPKPITGTYFDAILVGLVRHALMVAIIHYGHIPAF